jgi:hypothetical protein
MPEATPSFIMEYEREMRAITEVEYARRLQSKNVWWNKVLRPLPIERKTERVTWFLDTASIEPVGPTGTGRIGFEDLVTMTTEYPTFRHAKGLRVTRDQIEDLDGTGLDALAKWSENIGNEIAYYPQVLASQLILNGANTDGSAQSYDGSAFFSDNSTPHPNNPYNPPAGYYTNWLHGAAQAAPTFTPSGFSAVSLPPYPGACPIDESVTVDVALQNLGKAIAYVASLKMPNGRDPRFLTVAYIIAPPRMAPRVRELTKAKYIAQMANGSGGGSADIEALVTGWGLGTPIIAQEFAASTSYSAKLPFIPAAATGGGTGAITFLPETVTGSDTTYYLVCEEMQTTRLGGLLYVSRKPFKVNYYTGDAGGTGQTETLDRMNEFEYHVQGRVSCQYGHPYTIFRVDST